MNLSRMNGARLFWSATVIFSLIVLLFPADTDYGLRLKVLLVLTSPLCVLVAFLVVAWVEILWSGLILPSLKAVRRLLKNQEKT